MSELSRDRLCFRTMSVQPSMLWVDTGVAADVTDRYGSSRRCRMSILEQLLMLQIDIDATSDVADSYLAAVDNTSLYRRSRRHRR